MKTSSRENTSDPATHCENLSRELTALIDHLKRDVDRVGEPQFKALSETAAEVLAGLRKAFDHYRQHREAAWRASGPSAGKTPRRRLAGVRPRENALLSGAL